MNEIESVINSLKEHANITWSEGKATYFEIVLKPSDALVLVIALEKQVPKKTVIACYNYSNLPVEACPVCGERGMLSDFKFCKECGQKLLWDWSE